MTFERNHLCFDENPEAAKRHLECAEPRTSQCSTAMPVVNYTMIMTWHHSCAYCPSPRLHYGPGIMHLQHKTLAIRKVPFHLLPQISCNASTQLSTWRVGTRCAMGCDCVTMDEMHSKRLQ